MNTKITEEQIKQKAPRVVDKAIMPGPAYFIILTVTIVLLLSFTVAFFAVFAKQSSGDNSNIVGDNSSAGNSIGNGGNQTVPKKSNYISKSASGVQLVGDQIDSNNVILVDIDRNESIAEKGADERIYPASMTKVMSLLVACENVKNLNKKLTVQQKTINYAYEMGGSLYGVERGDELTVRDLLYLTSYHSDTVAVLMLAEHVAGSEEEFVKLMNKKAQAIGLKNTHFDNATGLHSDDNYSTCREIAAIFAYALENPLCKGILINTQPYEFTTNSRGKCTIWGPTWNGEKRFAGKNKLDTVTVKGGKTGYIDESGVCLVSYAEGNSNYKRYIQVIVGLPKGSGLTEADSTREVKFVYNTYAN